MTLAIITKYVGPTNRRGERVKATVMENATTDRPTPRSATVPYEYNSDEDHRRAAVALATKLEWAGVWVKGTALDGTVWVRMPYGVEIDIARLHEFDYFELHPKGETRPKVSDTYDVWEHDIKIR